MHEHADTAGPPNRRSSTTWIGFCAFAAIALLFLWDEHNGHILGVIPYLMLLACPVIHFFMHRDHGAHGGHR